MATSTAAPTVPASMETHSPLPVGLYWIDLFGANRAAFQIWLTANPGVQVRATESFPTPDPGRDWIKFEVLKPTPWLAVQFGYPTKIPPGAIVNSSADTAQRPAPTRDPFDELSDTIKRGSRVVEVCAVIGALVALASLWPRRGR